MRNPVSRRWSSLDNHIRKTNVLAKAQRKEYLKAKLKEPGHHGFILTLNNPPLDEKEKKKLKAEFIKAANNTNPLVFYNAPERETTVHSIKGIHINNEHDIAHG